MKRTIKKVAVLGSGIMGSRIACHFANIGVEVLLLDIAPKELLPDEEAKELTLEHPAVRNRIVNSALQTSIKTNPSPLYDKSSLRLIKTGNFDDDLPEIAQADWVLEAVIERLDIKQGLFEKVEQYRKPGTLVSSNTSGIPIYLMAEGRSDDFKKHFCGTHFFNPPRYLRLLEIIPTPDTDSVVIDFLMHYGDLFLGKSTVLCKDTPAFIANRIGVFSIMKLLHYVDEHKLTVEEVDKYTGPLIGRPKSATFRTTDVVGLDTMIKVAKGLYENCPDDEARELFKLPAFVEKMEQNNWLGEKSAQGFYKKIKSEKGTEILSLDLSTMEYGPQQKVKSATLEMAKQSDDLKERLNIMAKGQDAAGELFRETSFGVFSYCSKRIPEISDELYRIDDAMRAGFGWELGPFEMWDALGVENCLKLMDESGHEGAPWVKEMLTAGNSSFYKVENGKKSYYDIASKSYKPVPGAEPVLSLTVLKGEKQIWGNAGVTISDLGDGIINCEFHTKMNALGGEVIEGLNKAVNLAEKDFQGLVIANEGQNFSAGANISLLFMFAAEQEWDEVNLMVSSFQNAMMRLRYSSIPVVAAPHNMALGGGCELCMHADYVQAHAELYMGLVEFGVGIIPAGGGTKEFALRASDEFAQSKIDNLDRLKARFMSIGMAKVSTSAQEAFGLGYLQEKNTGVTINRNRQLAQAKQKAIELASKGYTQPIQRKDIRVLGKQGLGMFTVGAANMQSAHFISEHDQKISEKLAWVICGGDLSQPTEVSEQYLLDLEREAFLSLCGEKKTLERIQSILTKGKPLRN